MDLMLGNKDIINQERKHNSGADSFELMNGDALEFISNIYGGLFDKNQMDNEDFFVVHVIRP